MPRLRRRRQYHPSRRKSSLPCPLPHRRSQRHAHPLCSPLRRPAARASNAGEALQLRICPQTQREADPPQVPTLSPTTCRRSRSRRSSRTLSLIQLNSILGSSPLWHPPLRQAAPARHKTLATMSTLIRALLSLTMASEITPVAVVAALEAFLRAHACASSSANAHVLVATLVAAPLNRLPPRPHRELPHCHSHLLGARSAAPRPPCSLRFPSTTTSTTRHSSTNPYSSVETAGDAPRGLRHRGLRSAPKATAQVTLKRHLGSRSCNTRTRRDSPRHLHKRRGQGTTAHQAAGRRALTTPLLATLRCRLTRLILRAAMDILRTGGHRRSRHPPRGSHTPQAAEATAPTGGAAQLRSWLTCPRLVSPSLVHRMPPLSSYQRASTLRRGICLRRP